jgi:DTW domain-containing protein YfiP
MCEHISAIDTKTKFVILMHTKEFKKTKNGTGHLTHLSLPNSELFMGIDFTHHKRINEILESHQCYILYPSREAINLSREPLHVKKNIAIFIIDSTWACALKMMRLSTNLHGLSHISFEPTKRSEFKIKEQPLDYCLSTIESTLSVLELLNTWEIERIEQRQFNAFLNPFHTMIAYQLTCLKKNITRVKIKQ